jgi:hypothetical protein
VADPETARGPKAAHGPRELVATRARWWVECADPFDRCRAMSVVVHEGRIVVVTPPGGAAVLSAHQTRLLGSAPADAALAMTAGPS